MVTKDIKKQQSTINDKVVFTKNTLSRYKLLFALGLFIFLLILTVVIFYVLQSNKSNQQNSGMALKEMQEQNKEIIMAQDGDIAGAVSLLNSEINNTDSNEQKIFLLNRLANLYYVVNKPQEAITTARKTIAISNNAFSWAIMGRAYELDKDYKNAVFAYQQALNLSTDSKDDGRGDYVIYNTYLVNARAKL